MKSRPRIIITGMVGLFPVGGVAWDYLQYVIGFARLGCEIFYHEDTWSWPYHPIEKAFASEADTRRSSWPISSSRWCASVAAHDRHFTYAENIHGTDCIIPKAGLGWKTTRMPIVLEMWEKIAQSQPPACAAWMTWNAFKGKLVYHGVEYKSKGSEFEKIIDLPRRVELPLQVAVGGVNAPVERLARHGWSVVDGPEATLTPERYRDFIAGSRGELSTAKHVYVATRSGWFSCRSACYLAAGRPVVVQDTGFSSVIPAADGLLPFDSLDEAAESLREVEADYERHAAGARALAAERFNSGKVLQRLIEDAVG